MPGVVPPLLVNEPPAPPSDQTAAVAPPPKEPPKAAVVAPWQIALTAPPALTVGSGFTVTVTELDVTDGEQTPLITTL